MTDELVTVDSSPELIRCMEYLIFRRRGQNITQIAQTYDVSRQTIYNWIQMWEREGYLEKARQMFLVPQVEELNAAVSELLDDMPAMIRRFSEIARGINTNSREFTQFQIGQWLWSDFAKPASEKKAESGAAESAYVKDLEQNFDPINITPTTTVLVPKSPDTTPQ